MNIGFVERFFISLALMWLGLAGIASAEPSWKINPESLPPGMTSEKALAMLEEIDRKSAKEEEAEISRQKRRAERIQRVARKYEDRLAKAIDQDPELRALRDKLEAGAKALQQPNQNDEEISIRLERMAPDVARLRAKGLANAGIDENAMNAEIIRELGASEVTTRSTDASDENEEYSVEDGGYYYAGNEVVEPEEDPGVQSRSVKSSTYNPDSVKYLGAPWLAGEERTDLWDRNSFIDKNLGKYSVHALVGFAGWGLNRRGLAHFETVPSGVRTIRVSAQLPESSFYNEVTVILFGGAQSRNYSRIEVWNGSSQRLCRSGRVHEDLWRVILGPTKRGGRDNLVLDCEFDAPAAGRDIVVKFVSDQYVNAWGMASAKGNVTGTPSNVKLTFIK
jgi:hypothetical protein